MSVFVVIFSVVVFLLAGLLVDGGAAINARLKAADIAEQGARAAADQIDVENLRSTGQVLLARDTNVVCDRAQEIVDAQRADGIQMTGCEPDQGRAQVTVQVSVHWNAFFLSALGFDGDDMAGSATAGPDVGVGG
jgi:Flp pilus assembly protein TadG